MDLKKFLPNLEKSEKEELYWSLLIEPGWVQAGIWKIIGNAAQVVFASKPVAWEEEDELVNASDTVLSAAIQNLPEGTADPSKTVFGVSYGWIKDGEIAPEHLEKIKKICTDLSLSPVGFVVMAEAITHLIKSETGTSVNGIVIGIYQKNLELSVFDKGKLMGSTQIARSVSIIEDVVEGLTRLKTENLFPSQIFVYDGRESDLEEARQELLKVDWENYESLKFLHTPKVEIVESERKVFAVSLAGASELASITSLLPQTMPEIAEEPEAVLKDIEPKVADLESAEKEVPPEELGFEVANVPVDNTPHFHEHEGQLTSEEDLGNLESNVEPAEESIISTKPLVNKNIINLGFITGFTKKLTGLFNVANSIKNKTPGVSGSAKPFVWGLTFMLMLVIIFGLFWWFIPKADVTIYLSPKKLEETIQITVDTKIADPDFSTKKVPGEIVNASVSGEKTTDTSGNKTVGEKAKGEVTIYRVGPQISLSSGTVINGPQNLKFEIEGSTLIASGSASTPGETKISVTAENIGSEYNIASGTTFTVGNYSTSDMEAKNVSSFSGGSSRDIRAVALEDQTKLKEELQEELAEKAKNDLSQKLSDGEFLVEESLESADESTSFNHKVGDEADSIKLTLNSRISGVVVKQQDLANLAEEALKSRVSSGYVLNDDQINYSFGDFEKDGDAYKFEVKVVANLLPDVDDEKIKSKIKGRQIQIAKDYLQTDIPSFTRVEIKIKPSFPGKLKTLPHVERNIDVIFSADR